MSEQKPTTTQAAPATAPQAAPAGTAALAKAPPAKIVGSYRDAGLAQVALDLAKRRGGHIVSTSMVIPQPPEGFEVAIAVVHADLMDTYRVGGKKTDNGFVDMLGLGKSNLMKIANNAGVTILVSRRVDNGAHPHFCAWEVWAEIQGLDGRVQRMPGNVEMDLRDGSPQVEAILDRAKGDGAHKQIREMRLFLTRHAETKAMLRAIRAVGGIRTSYTREELDVPFVTARLFFTGKSEDPVLRERFAMMIAEKALAGESALFGGAPQALPALRVVEPPALTPGAAAAPPRARVAAQSGQQDGGDDEWPEDEGDGPPAAAATATTTATPPPAAAAPAASAPAAAAPAATATPAAAPELAKPRRGGATGKPIDDAEAAAIAASEREEAARDGR